MVRPSGFPVSEEIEIGIVWSEGTEMDKMGMDENGPVEVFVDPLVFLESFEGLFGDYQMGIGQQA